MDDAELIELFFEREERAIGLVAEKYGKYAGYIADNIIKNKESSEECVNDAYQALWQSIPPNKPESLKAYLARLVRNSALDTIRRESALKRGSGQLTEALDELSECSDGSDPEEEFDASRLKELINGFAASLESRQRKAFVKRYWYLCSSKQIADELDMKVGAVNVMLHRTREQLRAYLKKEGYDL